jgi:hypothetical protein
VKPLVVVAAWVLLLNAHPKYKPATPEAGHAVPLTSI